MIQERSDADAWRTLARAAIALTGTPAYVFSASHVRKALLELGALTGEPSRHWLSFKTQPLKPLIAMWRDWGLGIEVVSPYELSAAISMGLAPEQLLVNGTAKHRWLPQFDVPRLRVHIDSVAEATALATRARTLAWNVGVRLRAPRSRTVDPDHFGLTSDELGSVTAMLRDTGVAVKGVHFHIGTNVGEAGMFAAAASHARVACDTVGLRPEYLDVGGGLPVAGERPREGGGSDTFDTTAWSAWLGTLRSEFSDTTEIWFENGRFLSARAGALVLTVVDRKERDDVVYLICDGGRTNHARLSAVETHDLIVDPPRGGEPRTTVVCGPTCGAVDRLGAYQLPGDVSLGDRLLWMNAGAYAIPLETRFSFGLAPVVWCDADGSLAVVRDRETYEQWWSTWK